jgi:tripartite ATP-independent transporter DctM subunit
MTDLMLEIGAVWLFAILNGLPLFAAMGLAAMAFVMLSGLPATIVPQKMSQTMNSFPFVAAPLFIFMGNVLSTARITDRIVRFATAVMGSLRGGYAQASILSSLVFAGMAGSAVADAAGTGAVEIRAMKRAGYRPETAAAINASAATIGAIVPPSLPVVIYGVTSDTSVGRLFLAGIIPGLLMAASLMTMVVVISKRQGFPSQRFPGWRELWLSLRDGFLAMMTPAILLGGMFSGLFTPTEAAAVATTYALLLGLVIYRTLTPRDIVDILVNTVETVGVVTALVMAAGALGWCMSISRIPQTVAPAMLATIHSPAVFLLLCNAILLLVGFFMETLAAMLILIPILLPVAESFGVSPVQFGIMMIFNLILGAIHPPIGVVLFVASRIAEVSYETLARAVLPWLVPLLVVLMMITLWPPITMFLPNLVMGK